MVTPEVEEEFAKILVTRVRDAAIQSCDRILQSSGDSAIVKRWKEARAATPEAFAKALIPDIVDEAIANLLIAIDQELLRLSFTASNGKTIDLTSIAKEFGELSGSYGGDWVAKYSKERFIDDFADLKDFLKKPPDINQP